MDKIDLNRPYECFCGQDIANDYVCAYIAERCGEQKLEDCKILVVSDRNVGGYYYSRFEQQFLDKGIRPQLTIVDARNTYKNLDSISEVIRSFIDFDFVSGDWVIAFGGGGVLDIAAFACGICTADINLICVPTTLNAMAEGIVSRKAYLNSASHKNVLSADLTIKAVFADPIFLNSVPDKVKSNGYAAVIRYAMLADPNLMKELLEKNDLRVFLEKVFETRKKIELLNPLLITMGDEIAEAIEAYFRFMNYSEGEALALSILASVPARYREAMKVLYNRLGLPVTLTGVPGKMILKNVEKTLLKYHTEKVSLVDLGDDGKTWVLRELDRDRAFEILKKRLEVICAD
ncbi:MAG: iron-containing alcohol dehydrogenase [Clostridiales bacterium]|nr:iron-containing alcohol dehydrogenase [Clostridiales bacterium]